MSAKERCEVTGKFVEEKLTFDKNLFSAKYFQKLIYHQTTTKQTKTNELKIILCYKSELIRQSKGIINLAHLRTMFGYLYEENEFTANAESSVQGLHAQQPCKNFTHLICTVVFSAFF